MGPPGSTNGQGAAASFNFAGGEGGLAVDGQGNVYVADFNNNLIREITPGGLVSTLAGNGTAVTMDGAGTAASFNQPVGVAVDNSGNVYVAEQGALSNVLNNAVFCIRKISPSGMVSTLAALVNVVPFSLAVDGAGNVYVSCSSAGVIDKITPAGIVSTITGNPLVQGGADGPPSTATFSNPYGIAVDAAGNLYLTNNTSIRKITPQGIASTLAGSYGSGVVSGSADGIGAAASFGLNPVGIAVDAQGNVYVADADNFSIRKISAVGYQINTALTPAMVFDPTTGTISGTPTAASPITNYTIAAYNLAGGDTTKVSITINLPPLPTLSYGSAQTYTVGTAIKPFMPASTGVAAPAYNSTPVALSTAFTTPPGIAADAAGNVYVIDLNGNAVKKIPAGGGAPIIIGTGFSQPKGLTVDAAGNVYVADASGIVDKIPVGGSPVSIGSGFYSPQGVALDAAGNLYVSDEGLNIIFKIPAGSNTTVTLKTGVPAPTGIAADAAGNVFVADNNGIEKIPVGGGATVALGSGFSTPNGVAVDNAGNVYVGDQTNNAVKEIVAGSGDPCYNSTPGSIFRGAWR